MRAPSPGRWRTARALAAAVVALGVVGLSACSDSSDPATSSGSTKSSSATAAPSTTAPSCTRPQGVSGPVTAAAVAGSTSDRDVTSFDGTRIRAHWFPLPDATAATPKPTVLMGPGWSLAGDSDPTAKGLFGGVSIKTLNEAGYNVLTWDPRGFGASGGTAQVDDRRYEGRDVQQLIEWVSQQPGAQLDGPGDPRMGMVGASYGGGIQFVTAAVDCRVDAIVPIIAWHSLSTSLFKADTVKAGWAGILTSSAAMAHVDPVVTRSYRKGVETGTISEQDAAWFRERGPADLVKRIKAPTLIIQGTVDTLFTLDEGVTNYTILRKGDVPVAMLWFCGGHGVCLSHPGDDARVGLAAVAWLNRYVKQDTSVRLGPRIDVVDQNGKRYTAEDLPTASGSLTGTGSGTLQLTEAGGAGPPGQAASGADVVGGLAHDVAPAPATNAVDVKIPVETGPQLVLGAPTLQLTYSGTTPAGQRPTRVFAQLVDDGTGLVLGNQITPVAVVLDGATHSARVPLEWVAFTAAAGSTITLQIVASTVAYAPPRMGGKVDFSKIQVSLPVVTGMQTP